VRQRGNLWESVTIERLQDKPIKLFGFIEGSVALYDARGFPLAAEAKTLSLDGLTSW
jgi:hypothetical protein